MRSDRRKDAQAAVREGVLSDAELVAELVDLLPDAIRGRLADHSDDDCVVCNHGLAGQLDRTLAETLDELEAAEQQLADLRARIEALRLDLNADADYRVTKGSIGHRLRALLDHPATTGGDES